MFRPLARVTAMAFLALGSPGVYADDSQGSELRLPKFVASDAG